MNLKNAAGGFVDPWDVKVGEWIQFTDLDVCQTLSTDSFRDDSRMMFIEGLSYTAPYTLQISGGKVDTLTQQLNKLGLGSIG